MTMQIFALLQIPDPFFLTKYQVCILAIFQDLEVSGNKGLRQKFTSYCLYVLYAANTLGPDISSEPASTIHQTYTCCHYNI